MLLINLVNKGALGLGSPALRYAIYTVLYKDKSRRIVVPHVGVVRQYMNDWKKKLFIVITDLGKEQLTVPQGVKI